MSLPKKIAILWLVLLFAQAMSTYFIVTPISLAASLNFGIQSFITIVLFFLVGKEPTKRGKFIFINFAFFFLISIFHFIGGYFGSAEFRYNFYIYVCRGISVGLLALAIVYITCDTLFRDFSIAAKYLITILIVGGIFTYYYSPYFSDVKSLSRTQDYLDWKVIRQASNEIFTEKSQSATPEEIASRIELQIWNKGVAVGRLYDQAKLNRVRELFPYIENQNYVLLLLRPVYYNTIYMNVLSIFFILLFFGYQYKKDPPLGAYIEKLMLLFLIFCALEILHAWAYIKTLETEAWQELFQAGLYISTGILVLLGLFFSLRLRFIISPTGKDYEQELVCDAQRTTRWRDVFDDLLIRHYFNPKALKGRLLALRGKDSKK
ncbi:MAG: hypothetical protein ABSB78_13175 [Bacteroidota bacterium]